MATMTEKHTPTGAKPQTPFERFTEAAGQVFNVSKDQLRNDAAKQFEGRLQQAIRECVKLKYYPRRFEEMLRDFDGPTVARKLVASGDLQDGLLRIVRMNRRELSMESIMLDPMFHQLFTPSEIEAADWRLKQAEEAIAKEKSGHKR